jgi:hypothetical protein
MKQGDLFEKPEGAYARSSDPLTSHNAAALIDAQGLERRVLACLATVPTGLTTHEIEERTGIEWGSVTPRMINLERKGHVVRWGERVMKGRRVPQIVWRIAK